MPKQRRTSSSRPVAKKKPAAHVQPKRKAARKPARRTAPVGRKRATAKRPSKKPARKVTTRPVVGRAPSKDRQPAPPVVAASREQAVGMFERGFKALQQRQFDRAASALKAVITGFPDEKELQERARVYLSICERQARGAGPRPRSFEDRVNAATVFLNRGALDDGLRLLRDLESENPRSDHVQYLLTVAHTSAGDVDKALSHLRRAVELNPENRFLSTADADLEPLRQHAGFLSTLEAPPPPPPSSHRRTGAKKR
jgi:tetratricopeptide (TPR) repeat protein